MTIIAHLYAARWLLSAVALALYIASKYRAYKRLAAFKGPFSTGWSEAWHARAILSNRSHLAYKDVNDEYGPIARIGVNDLVTSSPELLARMSAARSPYTRSTWYNKASRIEPGKDHLFSEIDEEKHTRRRAQMAAGYSGKENLALESDIDARVEELLDLVRNKYASTVGEEAKVMDLGKKIQYFTLDVISTVGFGHPFGDLKADADLNDYIKSDEEGLSILKVCLALGLIPIMQWPPIARLLGPGPKDKNGFGKMMAVAREMIDARMSRSIEGRSDMLASFLRHGLSKSELFTEAMFQIMAASDTTATAIRSIMLYLLTHPRVYFKLQTEIDAAVSSGASPTAPGIASDACLKGLPYLQAVVREGLRVQPPSTVIVPKKVPQGGDTVTVEGKQYFLPGGTNVGYDALGVHHSKAMFGEDASIFRPERWLLEEKTEGDIARLAAMRRTTEMIFGYGRYQCLGKPTAWMEITKVLFEFFRHFDWALVDPVKPLRSTNYFGVIVQDQMWVVVTARKA